MAKGFKSAGRSANQKLNITSLMDVLTIILIFLLVNYSTVTEDVQLPDFITLPTLKGTMEKGAKKGVTIIVGHNRIQIEKKVAIKFRSFNRQQTQILDKVAATLNKIKSKNDKDKLKTTISLQADKDISYKFIDGVVLAAASVGITQIEFLALKVKE